MPEQGRDGQTIKREAWVKDEHVEGLVRLLRAATPPLEEGQPPRPLPAAEISERLCLFDGASRETRRRRIRELVAAARLAGHPIIADGGGIWWATTAAELTAYHAWRRKFGLADLVAASRVAHSPAADELRGQGGFF